MVFFNYIEVFLRSYGLIINFNIATLFLIVSFLKAKNFSYTKIALIVSTILTTFLIFSALWSINKLKVLNQEIFHAPSTITMLSGKLINTDDYNFSYYNDATAVAREPRKQGFERGRTLPIPYYNYVDIEADDKSSRIRISCSISGYGYCRNRIQKDINIDTLDGLHGIAYIKPIRYRGVIRNLIFYLEIKNLNTNLKKDRYFFEDLYKTELSYYYKIWGCPR